MANTVDVVRDQIEDRAHEILLLSGFKVPSGFKKDRKGVERFSYGPNFRGVPDPVWRDLFVKHPKEFWELVSICQQSFPTFCALLGKVVIKGGGTPQPFIFNQPQRVVTDKIADLIDLEVAVWLVILKARQLGITTYVALWQYWQLWRKSNVMTTFLGDKSKLIERQVSIVAATHDNMPDVGNIRPTLRADNKAKTGRLPKAEMFLLTRGSKPWNSGGSGVVAKNPSAVLGFQGTHATCSEAAFWNGDGNDVLFAVLEALTPQLPQKHSPNYHESSLIVESTPQGVNDFHDLYDENKDDDMDNKKWHTVLLPWFIYDEEFFDIPPPDWEISAEDSREQKRLTKLRMAYEGKPVTDEQMYWRELKIRDECGGDSETFDIWYISDDQSCFRAASGSVFQKDSKYLGDSVEYMEDIAPKLINKSGFELYRGEYHMSGDITYDPMPSPFRGSPRRPDMMGKKDIAFIPNRKGHLYIWEPPQKDHVYTIGGDASGGTGNDGSCAHIACVTCGQQAGELYANTIDPNEFADQCCHLGWWYNNALFLPEVNHMGSTVLKRTMSDWGYSYLCHDEKWDEPGPKDSKYGFSTSEQTKPNLVAYGVGLIRNHQYRIASRRLLSEMANFFYLGMTSNGNQMSGGGRAGNAHDDTVIAWLLAMRAVRQTPPGVRADFDNRRMRIPSAFDLGLNHTEQEGLWMGRGLNHDPYGDYGPVPDSISNLFEIDGFGEGGNIICPLQSGWQGYGLDLG